MTTTSMQHYFSTLPSTTMIWDPWTANIHLNTVNLNMINISSLEFCIWKHPEDHWNETQLHHLVTILSVPIAQFYKHMVSGKELIAPFMTTGKSIDDTVSIWTLFSHTGIYVMVIGLLIPTGLGIFCCYFFWCWPARLACQPLQVGSMWYTIVDDNVEAAPIYRCNSRTTQPIVRPHKNHDLHIEQEPTQTESQHKQQPQSKEFLHLDHWTQSPKFRECDNTHFVCCKT